MLLSNSDQYSVLFVWDWCLCQEAQSQQGERVNIVARHCLGAFCSGYGLPAMSGPSITARIHEQLRTDTEQAEVAGRPQHHDVEDTVMVAITSARPRRTLGIAAAHQCFMYLSLVEFRIV